MDTLFFLACFMGSFVFCLFAVLYRWIRRLDEVQQRLSQDVTEAELKPQRRRQLSDKLNHRIQGSSWANRVERQLAAADLEVALLERNGLRRAFRRLDDETVAAALAG